MAEPSSKPGSAEYLTIAEAAAFLGVSPATLRNWEGTGQFNAERDPVNGDRVYRRQSVLEMGKLLGTRRPALSPNFNWDEIGESEHFVQFYETDEFLVESVSEFFARGLLAGEAAIVLATREHRLRIENRLESRGVELSAARQSGQYVALDPASTLDRFMDGDLPDRARFIEIVGREFAAAARNWPRVRAFGEMVALLWQKGLREAACRTEQLWNDLAKEHSFALFCAYPMSAFGAGADGASFAGICSSHTRVIPTEDYSALSTSAEQLHLITLLQQKARALEAEMEQRRQVEQELSDFLDNALEGLHKVGPDGRILWANQAELDLLGYSREEYIGRHIAEFHADQDVIEQILADLLAGKDVFNCEARLRAKDGSIKHVLIHSNGRYHNGEFLYTRCFTRDVTESRKAQRDRALLAAIVESTDDAIISKDLNGVITSWNGGAQKLFGYSADEAVGRPVTMLIPEERLAEETAILASIRRGERVQRYETVRRRKDGKRVDVSLTVSPVIDAAGRVIGASKIVRDITAWKEAATKLTQSEEQYRRLAELLPVGVYACEATSGTITYYNAEAARLWGRTPELGDTDQRFCGSLKLYLPDGTYLPHHDCPMSVALRDGREFRNEELVIEHPDGSRMRALVNVDPIRDADGRITGAINVFHDVSALKEAEEALREQKENLETLLETVPVAVLIAHDPQCRRISGNPAAASLLRMPQDANLSMSAPQGESPAHFRILKAGAVAPPEQLPLQRAAQGEVVAGESLVHEFDDGTHVHAVVSAQPLYDSDGRPRGAVGSILDVTELKNAENELRERDRRKDGFLAMLAHELRNPLAPIRTGLDLMKMGVDDRNALENIRATLQRQTEQLITIVDDLLDVSRITRGKLELRKCRVELSEVVQSAVEAARPVIDEACHKLTVQVPEQVLLLDADPHRLSQVLSNLLNNAAKYTPRNGAIRLAAERRGSEVRFTVTDTGIGIPADMRDRIFEMFAQGERPQDSGYTGLGIGLTLVRSLVRMHGGSINVESEGPGKGSTFYVDLPVIVDAGAGAKTAPFESEKTAGGGHRVLIVDDNEAAARMLRMMISAMGNEARTAGDGREAIDVAAQFRPEIVLMDIGMPQMNGYEAARRIRQESWGKNMLLVALTGWGQAQDKERTREAGFDHHLVKPAESAALEELFSTLGG